MKVVLLSPYSLGASSCKRMYYLSRNLKVDRTLFLLGEDKYGKTRKEDWFEYTARRRNDCAYPLYLLRVLRMLAREKPDVIHYSKPHHMTLIPAVIYGRVSGCKLVFDCDDWEPIVQKELGAGKTVIKGIEKMMEIGFKTSNAIVIPNTKMKKKIPAKYRKKIHLIPNGVDTKKFRPLKAKKNGVFNAVYMGTIHKINTITPLVEAVGIAVKNIKNLHCTVVGGGKGEQELRRMIKEQKLMRSFKLLGMQPHDRIPELLSKADVLVLPYSRLESLEYASNLKFFEYMALEKPIVSAAVGDIPMILEEGKAGYLFPPGNPKAMAAEIANACLNPKEAAAKAMLARKIAVEKYDWDILSKKLERLYKTI